MAAYLLRRLSTAVLMLLGVATVTFLLIHAAPGDPADLYIAEEMDPRARAAVLASFGLDRPLHVQYARWLSGLARGDLGWSISHRRPVAELLRERLPLTLQVAVSAFLLQVALGSSIGVLAAARRGGVADTVASGAALIIYSVPSFWVGSLLILVFAIQLDWFPSSGSRDLMTVPYGLWATFADRVSHLVLPVTCLALGSAACTARFVRSGTMDALAEPYAAAARARGARPSRVLMVHALRNVVSPVIALAGMSLPALLGGTVLVESVFSWPGMGSLSVDAVFTRDYPVVVATQMLLASLVVAGSFAADAGLLAADPRVRELFKP